MNKTLGIIMVGALLAGMAIPAHAASKRERKNQPKSTRMVSEAVTAAGEAHFPEKMKISKIGSIKTETTYFHIYCGFLKKGGYHAIVFDNTPKYLGYYLTEYEPSSYEDGGAILLDMDDGNSTYEKIRVEETGPVDNTRIDGIRTKFIKAPETKEKKTTTANGADEGSKPVFRKWMITHKGKKIPVQAIYVSQTFGKVTLRAEASGTVNDFPMSSLSDEDRAYIKQFQ
jgi:hypothetical protein